MVVRLIDTPTGPDLARPGPDGAELRFYGGSPSEVAAAQLAATDLHGVSLAVIIGLGLGDELLRLWADHPVVERVLVIEPDPDVIALASARPEVAASLERDDTKVLAGLDAAQLQAALYRYFSSLRNGWFAKALQVVVPEGALRFDRDYVMTAARLLAGQAARALLQSGNSPEDELIGLRNIFANLDRIIRAPHLQDGTGALAGRPAIVAAAGPSLSRQFAQLREVQDRITILAADTAIKPLLANGVRPHIGVSKERTPRTGRLLEEADASDTWLFALPVLDKAALDAWSGDLVTIFSTVSHFPFLALKDRPLLPFGGSAGNLAFRVAQELGADPIILVGQDLAFAPDGATHVEGAATGSRQDFYDQEEQLEVPGNLGGMVRTTPTWKGFLDTYVFDLTRSDVTCINTSEGGAAILGTQVAPLSEALASVELGDDPRALLREKLRPRRRAQIRGDVRRLRDLIRTTTAGMQALILACEAGIVAADAAVEAGAPDELRGELPSVSRLSRRAPLDALRRRQSAILADPVGKRFLGPILRPIVVHREADAHGMQRTSADAYELCERLLPWAADWFRVVTRLARATAETLPIARESLGGEHHA